MLKKFVKLLFCNKCLIVCVLIMFCLSIGLGKFEEISVAKFNGFTIVIDAGHGGRDGGSVGVNGTIEKEINLLYAKTLKEKLVDAGYRVVMTRETDAGLYSPFAQNKKLSDMNKRMNIIKKANPNLVISIHMNSFSSAEARGVCTYHKIDDPASIEIGNIIQKLLKSIAGNGNEQSKAGDFFMLNCSYYTSILIECGFLSNPEEERLLNSKEYMDKIVSAIVGGVMLYFGCV